MLFTQLNNHKLNNNGPFTFPPPIIRWGIHIFDKLLDYLNEHSAKAWVCCYYQNEAKRLAKKQELFVRYWASV